MLFPALRLGYAVLPPHLVAPFVTARGLVDGFAPTLPQMAVAEFFAEGHFGVHIRRMRELYRERRDALVDAGERRLPGRIRLGPVDAGLHAAAHLISGADDRAISTRAARLGVDVQPISRYHHDGAGRGSALFLGYAAISEREILEGINKLPGALTS